MFVIGINTEEYIVKYLSCLTGHIPIDSNRYLSRKSGSFAACSSPFRSLVDF